MEKAEILSRLKTFEANLADQNIESKDRAEVIYNAWDTFDYYNKRLRRESIGIFEYDKEEYAKIESGQEKIFEASAEASKTAAEFRLKRSKNELKISKFEEALKNDSERFLKESEAQLAYYDEWLERKGLSSDEKRRVELDRAEFVTEFEKEKDSIEKIKKRIEELKKENDDLTVSIKEQEDLSTSKMDEYKKNEEKLDEIKVAKKLTPEQTLTAQYEANLLYTRYKFLEIDPKKELSILISEYESGRITERDLILRLSDINEILNTVMYDLSGVTTLATPEAVVSRRAEINQRITELEKKIEDKSNYKKQNKNAENILWGYTKILGNIDVERKTLESELKIKKADLREFESDLDSGSLSDAEKVSTKAKIEDTKKEINKLKLKLDGLDKREEDTKNRILEINEDFVDKDARAKDIALLAEQNALLAATYSEEAKERKDFISEFDGFARTLKSGKNLRGDDKMYPFLRNVTPEERAHAENLYKEFSIAPEKREPERQYPPFWDDLSEKQKSTYFDLIDGHTPEEIEEFNKGISEGLAAEKAATKPISPEESERWAKEVDNVATGRTRAGDTVMAEGDTVPEGMRIGEAIQPDIDGPTPPVPPTQPVPEPKKVKTWKNIKDDAIKKIKDDWNSGKLKKNLKDLLIALGIIAVLGTTVIVAVNADKNAPTPTPTPTPTATQTVNPTPTHKPGDKDKPDVTPPVINPTPTPTPTTGVINLETAAPAGTGDSAPADEYKPYLNGLSVQETSNGTYVDSKGNKLTRNADGTYSVLPDSQQMTPGANGTVNIPENLNMSPVPTPTPLPVTSQAPISYEEAVASGALDPEEAAMAQGAFDGEFAEAASATLN